MDKTILYTFCMDSNEVFVFGTFCENALDRLLRHFPSLSTSHSRFVELEDEVGKVTIEFTIVVEGGIEVSNARMDTMRICNYLMDGDDPTLENLVKEPLPLPKPILLPNNGILFIPIPNRIPLRPLVEVVLESDKGKEEEEGEEIELEDTYEEWLSRRTITYTKTKVVTKETTTRGRGRGRGRVAKEEKPKKEPKKVVKKKPTPKGKKEPPKGKKDE